MLETKIYALKIGQCESKNEYEQLVRDHQKLYVGWKEYITPLLHAKKLTSKQVAKGCNISLSCAAKFARMIPAKRENVIMLAMMLGLSVQDTNYMLMRWAKFQKLYSRNPEDAIWIYLLERGGSMKPYKLFHEYYAKYLELYQAYLADMDKKQQFMTTDVAFHHIVDYAHRSSESTEQSNSAERDIKFIAMIKSLLPSFESGYQKLISYLESMFYDTGEEDDVILGLEDCNAKRHKQKNTPNTVFQNNRGWLDLYYRKIRELEKKRRIPSRAFLICLGLHFTMDSDQINALLNLAGMGPLCPKDHLEGSVIFYLEELYCQFPAFFFQPEYLRVDSFYNQLEDYSNPSENRASGAKTQSTHGVTIPDYIKLDIDDFPEETLSDYIKRRIEETNIFDEDEDKKVKRFLEML